jgi:DNA-binding response OmpR family regulator
MNSIVADRLTTRASEGDAARRPRRLIKSGRTGAGRLPRCKPMPKIRSPFVEIGRQIEGRRRLLLFLNGRHVPAPPRQIALLECLCENEGRVVPFSHLCRIIGRKASRASDRHMLRQYMSWIQRTLKAHKVPLVLAAARHVGYALCEITDLRS